MQHTPANRMAEIAPFHVMKLLARARELEAAGRSIVHMEIGEPDFETPRPIVQAGIDALKNGLTHYTPALGLSALREAIANHYKVRYGIKIDPGTVIVTPGSSGALQLACGVLVNPDDEVLLTDPGYPCNKHFVQLMGGIPKFIQLSEKNNYQLSLDELEKNWSSKTRAIVLASPSNPTGIVLDDDLIEAVALFAKQKNAYLVLDEIYHGLIYGTEAKSFAGRFDNVFIINSFSKYFCMTGWRIGWLISPKAFVNDVDKLAQNIFLAASTPGQYAALAAFSDESIQILESYRIEFQQRRDYLFDAIQSLGFQIKHKPAGAFYLYANSSQLSDNSFQLAEDLLENVGVAITPGKDFGESNASSHVRFAYTTSIDQLELGVQKLRLYFGK